MVSNHYFYYTIVPAKLREDVSSYMKGKAIKKKSTCGLDAVLKGISSSITRKETSQTSAFHSVQVQAPNVTLSPSLTQEAYFHLPKSDSAISAIVHQTDHQSSSYLPPIHHSLHEHLDQVYHHQIARTR